MVGEKCLLRFMISQPPFSSFLPAGRPLLVGTALDKERYTRADDDGVDDDMLAL